MLTAGYVITDSSAYTPLHPRLSCFVASYAPPSTNWIPTNTIHAILNSLSLCMRDAKHQTGRVAQCDIAMPRPFLMITVFKLNDCKHSVLRREILRLFYAYLCITIDQWQTGWQVTRGVLSSDLFSYSHSPTHCSTSAHDYSNGSQSLRYWERYSALTMAKLQSAIVTIKDRYYCCYAGQISPLSPENVI